MTNSSKNSSKRASCTILGKRFAVHYRPEAESAGNLGDSCYSRQLIHLADNVPPAVQSETLLHEVLHMISDSLSLGLTESLITSLACGLHSAGCSVALNRQKARS